VLRLGASGPAVQALQRQLNALGESLLASGQFGPRTLEAVRRFQVAKGIQPATGIVDAATQRVLAELQTQGNPRNLLRVRRTADWFEASAQTVTDGIESNPESVLVDLSDGRSLTVEQALGEMNAGFQRARGGAPRDPEDARDVQVGQVNHEADQLGRKGYLTVSDRKQLGHSLKTAFETLGEVTVVSVSGEAPKPAVVRLDDD
jgi:peptidoglycan hydrolase-like protein with peptidoglycan-binding domain